MDRKALSALPSAVLTEMVDQLYALICRLVVLLITVADVCRERGVHLEDQVPSMEDWLRIRLGVRRSTAREYVRMGRAASGLPATSAALAGGLLSVDQFSAVSRYATPETDEELARTSVGVPVTVLDRRARRARDLSAEDADASHRARRVRIREDRERGEYHLWARLPGAEGAVVRKALELEADRMEPDPVTGVFAPYEMRLADALVGMARDRLGGQAKSSPERATVVVHVDAAALASGQGYAEVQGGPPIAIETAKRLLCDANVRTLLESEGRAVGIGRRSRSVPPAIEQIIWHRDGGCVFLGCGRRLWVQVHHLKEWGCGGPTDAHNLVLVCPLCHQLVHEGGWRIEGNPYEELIFRAPDGREWRTGPAGLHAETRARFFEEDPISESPEAEPAELPPAARGPAEDSGTMELPDEPAPPYDDTS